MPECACWAYDKVENTTKGWKSSQGKKRLYAEVADDVEDDVELEKLFGDVL